MASPHAFAGAVIFEPAAVTSRPLAGENGAVVTRARAAAERLDAIEHAMPQVDKVVMHKRDHGADLMAPKLLAHIIGTFADKVLHHPE